MDDLENREPKSINKDSVPDDTDYMAMLTQEEADEMIRLRKVFTDKRPLIVNRPYNEKRELKSERQPQETFYLHITQTAIDFGNYSTVVRNFQIPLVRACIDPDKKHPNPDGTLIEGVHLHVYREGYLDRYAIPLPRSQFPDISIAHFIRDFLIYCNIEDVKINDQGSLVGMV